MADYYKLLGLTPTATAEQVARAIRRYEARQLPKDAGRRALVERAQYVLRDEQRRAAYDRVHGLNQDHENPLRFWLQEQELATCRQRLRQAEAGSQWLRTQRLEVSILQQELLRCRQQKEALEVAQRRWRDEPAQAQAFKEELAARRRTRRRLVIYLAAAVLALALPGLVRSLFAGGPTLEEQFGRPYQPVAAGVRWGAFPDSAVQRQVELMPQFRGGAAGLRVHIRDQVLTNLPLAKAEALLATGQLSVVVDSAGRVGAVRALHVPDSASHRLLVAIGRHLPRFIPGFQEARPASVRLTLTLHD